MRCGVIPGDRSEYEHRSHRSSQGIDPDTGKDYGGPHGDFTAEDNDEIMDRLEAEGRASREPMEEDPTGPLPEQPEVSPEGPTPMEVDPTGPRLPEEFRIGIPSVGQSEERDETDPTDSPRDAVDDRELQLEFDIRFLDSILRWGQDLEDCRAVLQRC